MRHTLLPVSSTNSVPAVEEESALMVVSWEKYRVEEACCTRRQIEAPDA